MSTIKQSLECICSILYDLGIDYIVPEVLERAKKEDTCPRNKSNCIALLKGIHDLIVLYKSGSRSVSQLWSQMEFDHRLVFLFVRKFCLKNGYPRAMYISDTKGKELLYTFCWIFMTLDILGIYLSSHINDQMFYTDASLAFYELQKESAQAVKFDEVHQEDLEDISNTIAMKANKIYIVSKSLQNKGRQSAILCGKLNSVLPCATPIELQLIADTYSSNSHLALQKLHLHENQIRFQTLIYNHITTFIQWIESMLIEQRLKEKKIEERILEETSINIEELQNNVLTLYQELREKLVEGANTIKQRKLPAKFMNQSKESHLPSFMDAFLMTHIKRLAPAFDKSCCIASREIISKNLRLINLEANKGKDIIPSGVRQEINRLSTHLQIT